MTKDDYMLFPPIKEIAIKKKIRSRFAFSTYKIPIGAMELVGKKQHYFTL